MRNKEKQLILIKAVQDDYKDVWIWRNHIKARQNSFNNKVTPLKEHKKWFCSKIKDKNTKMSLPCSTEIPNTLNQKPQDRTRSQTKTNHQKTKQD